MVLRLFGSLFCCSAIVLAAAAARHRLCCSAVLLAVLLAAATSPFTRWNAVTFAAAASTPLDPTRNPTFPTVVEVLAKISNILHFYGCLFGVVAYRN